MKLTKRKGFNFFRSYFDVYNELETSEDKAAFIDALLDRQFLGIKPTGLKGMSKFAYISQTNSIDSQVKGYEDKTGIKLNQQSINDFTPPTVGVNKKVLTPTEQVQVEGKGKEEVKEKVEGKLQKQKGGFKDLVFAFDSDEFIKHWDLWLQYRKESKSSIKGLTSAQGQMNKIAKLSNGSESKAIEVIMQSIENNWKGLFELKNNKTNGKGNGNDFGTTERQLANRAAVERLTEKYKDY